MTIATFAHAELRRMRAEVMLDCISEATDTKNKFPGLPLGPAPCRWPTATRRTTS